MQYFRLIACNCNGLDKKAVCNPAMTFCEQVRCLSVERISNLVDQLHFVIGRTSCLVIKLDGLPKVGIALCDKGGVGALIAGQGRDQSRWR